jgi:predicted Zn-dependent protease
MYVFVVPDRVWIWIVERLPTFERAVLDKPRWIIWLACVAAGTTLAAFCRFDHALLVGCLLLVVPIAAATLYRDRRVATFAIAHLAAMITWTAVDRISNVASDYYLLWGGHARRTNDRETAELLYRKTLAVDPDQPTAHLQLGRLLLARNSDAEGLAELHAVQQLEPHEAAAFTAEARWLATHGKHDEALAKAKQATAADPKDKEARSFLDSLGTP